MEIEMQPRAGVNELIEAYLAKRIDWAELFHGVAALGYNTTSLYEMVRAVEASHEHTEANS